jgi:hypothetical protein
MSPLHLCWTLEMLRKFMKNMLVIRYPPKFYSHLIVFQQQPETQYRWHKYGDKYLSKFGVDRSYYRCAERSCGSKKFVDRKNGVVVKTQLEGSHNHPAPDTPPLQDDVKQHAKALLQCGRTPSQAQKEIIEITPVITPSTVPTARQLQSMKYEMKKKTLPGHDAVQNVISLFGACNFLHKLELFPAINIVLASPVGLDHLARSATVYIDGTFDLCEMELVLTTLMVVVDNIAVPVVWLLSNSKRGENSLLPTSIFTPGKFTPFTSL